MSQSQTKNFNINTITGFYSKRKKFIKLLKFLDFCLVTAASLCTISVCCVCTSPQPSLNQEGRSEKRLRSTTTVFLLCVCETPDGCLSCSHANAGPGTMATSGPHMQKAEARQRAEEVSACLMSIAVVS